jgi:hypothetical protein
MAYDIKENRLRRKEAVGMELLVKDFVMQMKLASGLNKVRAAHAWNEASGAARYTMDVNLYNGILYVVLNSSMARNQLYFQKDNIMAKMNELLDKDELFVRSSGAVQAIKNIVLK